MQQRYFRRGEKWFEERRGRFDEAWRESLRQRLKTTASVEEFRRLLCLWLPMALGLHSGEVATAVGWTQNHVLNLQGRYRRHGEAALQSKPRGAPPPTAAEPLRAAMKQARNVTEFRRAQCLWMLAALGVSAETVARAEGWPTRAVWDLQQQYRRHGETALRDRGRGGRRHQIFNRKQEYALLRRLRQQAWPSSTISFQAIHQAVEKEAGRPVKPSTVQQMIGRHGWGRASTIIIPQHKRPAPLSNQALEALRSGRRGLWFVHLGEPEEWLEAVREAKSDAGNPPQSSG